MLLSAYWRRRCPSTTTQGVRCQGTIESTQAVRLASESQQADAPAGNYLILHFDSAQSPIDLELEFVAGSRRASTVEWRDRDAVGALEVHQPARYRTTHWECLRHRLTARTSVAVRHQHSINNSNAQIEIYLQRNNWQIAIARCKTKTTRNLKTTQSITLMK